MATGIFYHPSFSRRSYMTVGNRLRDFPDILEPILDSGGVEVFTSPRVDRDLLLAVHDPRMIESVDRDPFCSTAWESAGGVVRALEDVWKGDLDNAFAFIGAGGHHSGRDYFGGACCFNDVAVGLVRLRQIRKDLRLAVLDTDAHHGDGTRDLLGNDPGVLHCCICSTDHRSDDGLKIDASFTGRCEEDPDPAYLSLVREVFPPALDSFSPDLLVWYFGFDTHSGDYGSVGLTGGAYPEIARLMIGLAEEHCDGKLAVVLAGGSRHDLAAALIPPVIRLLAGVAGVRS